MDGTIPAKLTPAGRDVLLGRCTGLFTIKFFVAYAYNVDPADVTGVKDWMPTSFYDIEAVAGNTATATTQDLRMMLQTLLAERFKLKVHRETHDIQGLQPSCRQVRCKDEAIGRRRKRNVQQSAAGRRVSRHQR